MKATRVFLTVASVRVTERGEALPERMLLPLSSDQLGEWRGSVEKAQQVRKTVCRWWDANLKKYAPDPSGDPEDYGKQLNTNRDFTLVERKKADLFFQR